MIHKVSSEHFKDIGLSGYVEVDMPSPLERMSISASIALDGEDLATTMKQAESLAKAAWDRIKKVSLVHNESGMAFNSLDDLSVYAECSKLLYAVGGIVLNGVPLGKH